MSFNVIYNIVAQDKFSRVAIKIAKNTQSIRRKMASLGPMLSSVKSKFNGLSKKIGKAGKAMRSFGKDMTVKVTAPLAGLGTVALIQSAKLETLQISLETMTGSVEKAKKMMQDMVAFTASTPFQLSGVGGATKLLLAFQVKAKNMIPTLRMLGDIASGTNKPLAEIALIFGKSKAKGKMMTEELYQLAEKGVPIIETLAKGYGVAESKIQEMASKSQITFEVMQKALKKMTSKGGVFFEQTIRQSQTLAGRWSTLKDVAGLAMGDIGDQIVKLFNLKGKMKEFSAWIEKWAKSFKEFAEANPKITKLVFIIIALVAAVAPLIIALGAIAAVIPFLVTGFGMLAVAVNTALWPVLAATAAFTAAYYGATMLFEFLGGGTNVMEKLGKAIYFIVHPFELLSKLFDKLKDGWKFIAGLGLSAGKFAIETVQSIVGGSSEMKSKMNNTSYSDNKSSSTIDVNLNAPQGVVKSIKSRSDGNAKLNVGNNMVAAY